RPARIGRGSVLRIRLSGPLHELPARSPLDRLLGRGLASLHNLRRAFEGAAHDDAIKAVIVEIAGFSGGFATSQELHDLMEAACKSGKRVIALLAGDNVTEREYLVACGASEIVANPDTAFMMLGVAAGNYFLRGALDQIGVEAQTLQWKEYKGAGETFARDAMSPALRESLEAIVADWSRILAEAVARARGLDLEQAADLLKRGFTSAQAALSSKLVDRVGYLEDLIAELNPQSDGRDTVDLTRYLRHLGMKQSSSRGGRIALVHGVGPVIAGEPLPAGEYLSGEHTAAEIDRAARDRSVRAIVFRVNSPGGSAVGADLVWRSVREAQRRGKPVVVSMGDVAGSGGYYVAMNADTIVAEPATVTGSIGVVFTRFSLRRLLARAGISIDYVKDGELADALSPARVLSESEMSQLNLMVGQLYENFTAKVAQGRKLTSKQAESIARGRVWSGVQAQARGLVDELGGLAKAVEIARAKAGFSGDQPHELVSFAEASRLSALRLVLESGAHLPPWAPIAEVVTGMPRGWLPALLQLFASNSASLLMPFF
ncbi:MAG TPA: signal peptide peptidase SppA, partial [Candidatus Binataceae bacterium]